MKTLTMLFTICFAALTATSAIAEGTKGWPTDLEKALVQAKAEKKPVMVQFTGSTWCPQCVVMGKNVFSTKEFQTAATKKYILVEIDVPASGAPKEEGEAGIVGERNTQYAITYKVNEFPHTVLIAPDGKEFTRFHSADFPKTEDFLKKLDESLEKKDLD